MFSKERFGGRLSELRREKGLSQAEIARLLGVSTTQAGDMERGKTGTTLERLVLLSEYFHVSTDYLLGREKGEKEDGVETDHSA